MHPRFKFAKIWFIKSGEFFKLGSTRGRLFDACVLVVGRQTPQAAGVLGFVGTSWNREKLDFDVDFNKIIDKYNI